MAFFDEFMNFFGAHLLDILIFGGIIWGLIEIKRKQHLKRLTQWIDSRFRKDEKETQKEIPNLKEKTESSYEDEKKLNKGAK